MIEDAITQIVEDHYQPGQRRLLMLSNLGARLSKLKYWPLPPEDKRSLRDVIDAMPEFSVEGDPESESFLAVVRKGEEQRVRDEIAARKLRYFLKGLPRALLIAFTLETAPGNPIYLRLEQRITYLAGPHVPDENEVLVDDDLRLPGLEVGDIDEMADGNTKQLETNIRTWCERHGIDPDRLKRKSKPIAGHLTTAFKASSALERLYAAQDPEIAKRMTMPIDIALALSRLP